MDRMSRVGRKAAISKVLYQQFKRVGDVPMTVGEIAKKMGGKSSTNLRNMCLELSFEDENICAHVSEDATRFIWRPYKQLELPDRYISINGKQHKVANWVANKEEYQNA